MAKPKTRCELVEYKKNRGGSDTKGRKKWVYEIQHFNGSTTLSQDLIIESHFYGVVNVEIKFDEFPQLPTKKESAEKLADWLQRLSWAIQSGIKNGKFDD